MTPKSCKAKGRRLQQLVRERILASFPMLDPDDVRVAVMGENGEDVKLSPAARRAFPFSVECKAVEALNVWRCLEQAEANAPEGTTPLLVFKRNRGRVYVALELDELLRRLA